MDPSRISDLLTSYTMGLDLPGAIFEQLSIYLDLLLRWNARTNLTAIRDAEQIVTRHFGESLFAAGVLFGNRPSGAILNSSAGSNGSPQTQHSATLADFGSGAGFPGLPIKLAFPSLQVTLIESQNKKATFLKEVIRALRLEGIGVYSGRAEQWGKKTDIVTLRAVERFQSTLPIAKELLAPGGRLGLLIGAGQKRVLAPLDFAIEVERLMPGRPDSVVIVGKFLQ